MKAALRIGCVALIVLGLASQALRASRGGEAADARGALAGRLAGLHIEATDLPQRGLLAARSPRCDQRFLAGLLAIDGADDETTRQLAAPGVVVRYVYLGTVGERPSRWTLMARWAWATVLFDAGLRRSRPSQRMVVVAFAQSCAGPGGAGLDAIDWAALSP